MLHAPGLWIAVGYLLGSIPFGLLLSAMNGTDIRTIGSGNIGATNVLRSGNKGLAAATLVLDAGKGFLAVWLAGQFANSTGLTAPALAGFAAFVGHVFPVWLKFRGGKGVATMLGVTLGLFWPIGIAALLAWLIVAAATRYSSLGGMVAALVAPMWLAVSAAMGWVGPPSVGWIALGVPWVMAALLLANHRDNIARLRAGTESRIGQRT